MERSITSLERISKIDEITILNSKGINTMNSAKRKQPLNIHNSMNL